MAENRQRPDLVKRLNRLFRRYDIDVRHKIAASNMDMKPSPSMINQDFGAIYRNTFSQAINNFGAFDRTARCLSGDTKVAMPTEQGWETIENLAKLGTSAEFWVFAYDKENDEVKCVKGTNAHMAKVAEVIRVVTDHGDFICTPDHRVMLRDGSYKEAKDLVESEALMPFYRKIWNSTNKYRQIYNFSRNRKTGDYNSYTPEYTIVRESIDGVRYPKGCGIDIHHKDFNKYNNLPENLIPMPSGDHHALHLGVNKSRWNNDEIREKLLKKQKEYYQRTDHLDRGAVRKDLTLDNIKLNYTDGMTLFELSKKLKIGVNTIKNHLRWFGYKDFEEFSGIRGSKNKTKNPPSGYNSYHTKKSLTIQNIYDAYIPGMNQKQLVEKLSEYRSNVQRRIKWQGFKGWEDFVASYDNCKVIRLEKVGGSREVYDLSVPKFNNFSILNEQNQSLIFLHNCSDSEEMDTGETATALDLYAQESATYFEDGQVLHISSPDKKIEDILNSLFYEILNIEFNLHFWVRNMCKYGDNFLLLDLNEENGIMNAIPLPVTDIERQEGYDPKDPFSVKFNWISGGSMELAPWQVIHMRLLGKHKYLPYGTAKIDAARRIWRQLTLYKDAMLLYRLVRAPERKAFYVDVQGIKAADVPPFMKEYISKIRHNPVVDVSNSNKDLRFNPLDVTEDFFIPVRGGDSGTRIEPIPGSTWGTDMDDFKFLHDEFIASLGIPRAYLSYDENLASKATLSAEDVRFSRAVQQIQKAVISELSRIAIIHLYTMGFDGHKLVDFNIDLNSPSAIYEVQKLELWRSRMEIAQMIPENYKLPKKYVYDNIYKLPESASAEFPAMFALEKAEEAEAAKAGEAGGGAPGEGGAGTNESDGLKPMPDEAIGEEKIPQNKVRLIDSTPQSDVIFDTAGIEGRLEESITRFDSLTKSALKEIKKLKDKKLLD